MPVFLIADKDIESLKQMADLLINAGYNIIVANSAAKAIVNVLKRTVHIIKSVILAEAPY